MTCDFNWFFISQMSTTQRLTHQQTQQLYNALFQIPSHQRESWWKDWWIITGNGNVWSSTYQWAQALTRNKITSLTQASTHLGICRTFLLLPQIENSSKVKLIVDQCYIAVRQSTCFGIAHCLGFDKACVLS